LVIRLDVRIGASDGNNRLPATLREVELEAWLMAVTVVTGLPRRILPIISSATTRHGFETGPWYVSL
jgi:hypothetical protein